MSQGSGSLGERILDRRIKRKGIRPRVAAAIIAVLWLVAIVVFGILERLVDPDTFGSIWSGMWWATQTVTTVGYGDVVPGSTGGQLLATILMVGGLSLFAVVTGAITSLFVARAQQDQRSSAEDPVLARLDALGAEVEALRAELAGNGPGDRPA